MNRFKKNIETFLLSNTNWIHFSVLLFATIVLVNGGAERTWPMYFYYLGVLIFACSPQLLWATFSKKLVARLNKVPLIVGWSLCFIFIPFFLTIVQALNVVPYHNVNLTPLFLPIVSGAILVMELILYFNQYFLDRKYQPKWIKKISLEKSILLLMAFFSAGMFLMEVLLNENDSSIAHANSIFSFITFTVQFFIILFVYYIFYWVNHYILISKIFKKKGIIYYAFGFVATLFFLFPIAAELISWLPIVHEHQMHPSANEHPFSGIHFVIPLFGMLATTPIILTAQWFKQSSEIADLEKEKSATELTLLKQQINPHFFFNTLNNLYALSLTKDEKTPEVILQLSELMRYVIKRGKEEAVSIKEEIKYIEDYVWLQNIRLHKKLDFSFEKKIDDPNLKIPPLLFINLVENAFKHGIEPAEGDCFLHLKIEVINNELYFTCINSFEETTEKGDGMGLKNLRRRLQLRFPDQHQFKVEQENHIYNAILKLTL